MNLKVINCKKSESVGEIIDNLEDYAYTLEVNILGMDEIISNNQKTYSVEHFINEYEREYKLPKFSKLITEFYCTDSDSFEPEEYFIGHLSIASGLYAANFKRIKIENNYVPLTNENNIYEALVSLYPDPNNFVEKYDLYKSWQDEGYEPNAGVLWLDQIVELGFIKGEIYKREVYKQAVKNTLKLVLK